MKARNALKILEQNVGTFLSRPTYEWGPDGVSCVFHFSDPRTMRMVQEYIQNMREGIICKPWLLDTGDKDPFTGQYHLMVTWKDTTGSKLVNAKKAVQFVIAKWYMKPAEKSIFV